MNATQMKYEAQLLYESIASADAPGYTSKEWSFLLTAGQEKVIKDIIDKGLDVEERYRKAISSLFIPMSVTGGSLVDYSTTIPNAISVNLDADCLGTTMERGVITYGGTQIIKITPITYDFYLANINNPLKKPDKKYTFWRLDSSSYSGTTLTAKNHIIITDGSTITTYKYVKVKKPSPIIVMDATYASGSIDGYNFASYTTGDLDSLLDSFVHRWIIQEAVNIAYASDKDQIGYQISKAENVDNIQQ